MPERLAPRNRSSEISTAIPKEPVLEVRNNRLVELHILHAGGNCLIDAELNRIGITSVRREISRHRLRASLTDGIFSSTHMQGFQG